MQDKFDAAIEHAALLQSELDEARAQVCVPVQAARPHSMRDAR
jgi:hypothetical protein